VKCLQFVHNLIDTRAWSLDPEVIVILIDSGAFSSVVVTLPENFVMNLPNNLRLIFKNYSLTSRANA
jgi:hypothetical protein